jgi:hypothetical protein
MQNQGTHLVKLLPLSIMLLHMQTSIATEEIMGQSDNTAVGYISGNTFTNKEVTYDEVNGYAVYEGDIVLGTVEELQASTSGLVPNGILLSGNRFRWRSGFIPYTFEANLPRSTIIRIQRAMEHWSNRTSIRFVRRDRRNQHRYPNYVVFRNGTGCAAHVGRQGGGQSVWLSTACSTGNAIHEIGHTVGLWHEHSREDRNNYVQINWANIIPSMAHNFSQHITDGDDVGSYDYGSIMHYPRVSFSLNNSPTIEPINPSTAQIGQRQGLSNRDINTVNTIAGWVRKPGSFKQVSVGFGGEVWGVKPNNNIFRYNGNNRWTRIAGKLKHVSVGRNGVVWGVNSHNNIFRYNGNNSWTRISGSLKQVEVGAGGEVWGVNSNNNIFRYNGNNTWTRVAGSLKKVSVGRNGVVWGVNSNNNIFRYNGNNSWTRIPGSLKQLEVGLSGEVWGVNSRNYVFRYNHNNTWTRAAGRLKYVSVGRNGVVWGVNPSNNSLKLR